MIKIIFYIILLCSHLPNLAKASGCFPADIELSGEIEIVSIGQFGGEVFCADNGCYLTVSASDSQFKYQESHYLKPQTKRVLHPQKYESIEVSIWRQFWESSCGQVVIYTVGVDIDGVRFRDEDDLKTF